MDDMPEHIYITTHKFRSFFYLHLEEWEWVSLGHPNILNLSRTTDNGHNIDHAIGGEH